MKQRNPRVRAPLLLIVAIALSGCEHTKALYQTARDGAMTAGPPSLAAVLTSPLGPVLQFTVVFLTALVSKAVTDTAALRSGELSGEGALAKENERLSNTIKAIQGDIEYYSGQAATAAGKVREARTLMGSVKTAVLRVGLLVLAIYLLGGWRWWRNAYRWWRAGSTWMALWSVVHALCRPLPDPPLAPKPA